MAQPIAVKQIEDKPGYLFINGHTAYIKSLTPLTVDSAEGLFGYDKVSLLENKNVVFPGFDPYFYWLRFITTNTDSTVKNLYLLTGPTGFYEALLYQKTNGAIRIAAQNGNKYPIPDKSYNFISSVFPIHQQASSTDTFYLFINYANNYKNFALALSSAAYMHKTGQRVYFMFGLLIGTLLLFMLFNFYLFISLKEAAHFWYGLYIVSMMFFILKYEGFDEQFFPLDSVTANLLTPVSAVAGICLVLLIHAIQKFLSNISKETALYKIIIVAKLNLFISSIAHIYVNYISFYAPLLSLQKFVFTYVNHSSTIVLLLILFCAIVSLRKGFKPAAFIIAGLAVFIMGGFEKLLFLPAKTFVFPPSIFELGIIIEVAVISFGFMYRYRFYKKDKERLQLAIETQQANVATQLLQTQEAEQKRIAQDLHDELGGNLAAIKMTVQGFNLQPAQSETIDRLIDHATSNARNIAHNLMPPEFENTRFHELLGNYLNRINTEGSVVFNFHASGTGNHFTKAEELMLYRIILELVTNIIKHAAATEATIQLVYYDTQLEVMAEDNGKGFLDKPTGNGIGLKNIQSRINYLKGKLNIDTSEHGTTVIIQVPYNSALA